MAGAKRRKKSVVWRKIHALRYEDIKLWCVRRLPILKWAPSYNLKENLIPDTVSGMMLAIQQVPQGLAFAVLSSVHPVFGLYGSLFPVILYAIFGMGRHVATGTFALTSLISANAVERLVSPASNNFTTSNNSGVLGLSEFEMQRIGVAAAVSFLGGIIQVAMFVLHLGSATFLLTEPVISAMTTGAATHVVTSQVKYLLGMKMPYISGPLGFFYIYAYIFENIKSVQLEALLLSLVSLVVLVLVKELNEKFKRKIKVVLPIDLILIIATSIGCYCADMEYTYGLAVVGHIPEGIPAPKAPSMNILSEVVTEAFGVALVGYVASLALAQGSAKQFKYSVDDNQELLAHGLSNVIPSFFFCIPSAAAMGRTALLYSTGAKTQSIWVSTYVFTVCFAANVGLLYGVVCTIVIVIFRFQSFSPCIAYRAKTLSLKNMKEVESEFKTEADCESLQQVKIVSVNNPLVFLNAKKFHRDLIRIIQKDSASTQPHDDLNKCEQNTLLNPVSNGNCHGELSLQPCPNERCALILDCSGLTFFDYTGISVLLQICMDFKNRSIDVLLAHCNASLVKAMQYSGNLGSENPIFFESISSAIGAIHVNRNFRKLSDHDEV
ncbi:anion exchange transporter isoform X4 [Lepidochelys kempii]|uniref:anion exchange transporter isoform X4 n=1 Tax=Lepidochelys kempii TaxID=8472 RepID=UPI003C6FF290